MTSDLIILNRQIPELFQYNQSTFLAGNSFGHYMQMALLWLLPVYLMLSTSSWFCIDCKNQTHKILILKFGKKKYLKFYLLTVFLSNFFVFFINFLINYLLAFIINNSGKFSPYGINFNLDGSDLALQLNHPIISNLIFIVITCLLIGIFSVFISCISFIFSKISYTFFVAMLIWLLLLTGDFSVMLIFQPFAEYSFSYIGKIFAFVSVGIVTLSVFLYNYRIKLDEI